MTLFAIQGAVEVGLIYSLVALGLFVSYRTLDVADLTVDGSFSLGAAVTAVCTVAGHPFWGIWGAMAAGAAAGFVTALLQTRLKVQPILAGIITMTALYSINIIVMGGKSNLPLAKRENVYLFAEAAIGAGAAKLAVTAVAVAAAGLFLILFFRTPLGLSVRATGDNRAMVRASSINPAFTTTVGLCMANAIVALAGALYAQYIKVGDTTSGTGTVVIGLASLIMGEVIIGRGSVPRCVCGAVAGAILYRTIIAFVLSASVSASNLKLVSAVIVAVAISYPAVKERAAVYKLRKAGQTDAGT